MLELASTCVEEAAQVLFRRLEPPVRSHRALGHAFWKNGGNELTVPPWWPMYLETVRKIPQTKTKTTAHKALKGRDHGRSTESVTGSKHSDRSFATRGFYTPFRSFTKPSFRHESVPLSEYSPGSQVHAEQHGVKPRGTQLLGSSVPSHATAITSSHSKYNNSDSRHVGKPTSEDNSDRHAEKLEFVRGSEYANELSRNIGSRLESLLQPAKGERPLYDNAWRSFVALPNQHAFAARVMEFLSASKDAVDLDRALRAFSTISEDERQQDSYELAVAVAVKLHRYSTAQEINMEATRRSMEERCSQILLISCLKNGLWKNALRTCEIAFPTLAQPNRRTADDKLDQSGKLSRIEGWIGLPAALSVLATRLAKADPVLSQDATSLRTMAHGLLKCVARSTHIMGAITPEGILRLVSRFQALEMLTPSFHLNGLQTLHKFHAVQNRVEVAILLYRNLRSVFPDYKPGSPVYGMLISMCAEGGHSSKVFSYLMQEFSIMHGQPDQAAYQKVMTTLARQGDARGVQNQFRSLVGHYGFPNNHGQLTPLLYVHARLGDVKSTNNVLQTLKGKGLQPNIVWWNVLLYAHARSNRPEEAFDLFDKMLETGVRPDAYTFGTLMGLSASSGDTQAVHHLLDQARLFGVQGTTVPVETLIHSYCLNDEAEDAEKLAEAASKIALKGSPVRMWNILLRHYAYLADSDGVLRVQERMKEFGIKPDDMTYAALMTALVVLGRTNDAAKILRSLHLSRTTKATRFHYAIVLHGYSQEGKRDMANLIYHEMEHRFPRVSASARLSMLHMESRRDMTRTVHRIRMAGPQEPFLTQHNTTEFLARVLSDTTEADLADKEPQPGFGRRSPNRVDPSLYMEFLIARLARNNQVGEAEKLLERYESLKQSSYLNLDKKLEDSVGILTIRMIVATELAKWATVDQIWEDILARTIRDAAPWQARRRNAARASSIAEESRTPKSNFLFDSTENGANPTFTSMIKTSKPATSSLDATGLEVLPAQKFILSAALVRYMRALELQGKHSDIIKLVEKLQKVGFRLTSKNWNVYIQTLCKSSNFEHYLLAYETFDHKFLRNAPPWSLLRRGKWSAESSADRAEGPVIPRTRVEKTQPGQIVPTYFTAVYLGTVLMKFHRLARKDRDGPLGILRQRFPNTLRYIQNMPYLQDRIQGMLLRGRKVKGDPVRQHRPAKHPNLGGVLGSRSPLDYIPVEHLMEIEAAIAPLADESTLYVARKPPVQPDDRSQENDLELAEKQSGQIVRTPLFLERHGRYEDEREMKERVQREEQQKLRVLTQLRRDKRKAKLVRDQYFGEAHVNTIRRGDRKITPPTSGALFDPYEGRLEESSELKSQEVLHMSQDLLQRANPMQTDRNTRPEQTGGQTDARIRRLAMNVTVKPRHSPFNDTSKLASHIAVRRAQSKRELQAFSRNKALRAPKQAAKIARSELMGSSPQTSNAILKERAVALRESSWQLWRRRGATRPRPAVRRVAQRESNMDRAKNVDSAATLEATRVQMLAEAQKASGGG